MNHEPSTMNHELSTMNKKIILASKSPRRQELLKLMDLDFRIVLKEVDESYPDGLSPEEIAVYIAKKKAEAFDEMVSDEVVLTADTIVSIGDKILGKPENEEHAVEMLNLLSGSTHQVITGVCLFYRQEYHTFYDVSDVTFRHMTDEEIRHYVSKYKPMDKAGSYGIQEWVGVTGIVKINGSYTNVVGLPTEKLYQALIKL
nr:Maf family nucleotide pyrophosphatase [uncultured Mucilaginibacter sp.]